MDRFGRTVDLSTLESDVPRSNQDVNILFTFDHFKIDRGCIYAGLFFLGFCVDRFGLTIDLSTLESEVPHSNHRQECKYFDHFKIDWQLKKFCFVYIRHFQN